jgi:hypothetical protein
MKVYITNVLPSNIKNNIDKIGLYLVSKREIYELFSEEYGLHVMHLNKNTDPTIYRVETAFETNYHLIKNHKYNQQGVLCDLLCDLTTFIHIPVTSQLPTKYVLTKLQQISYKIDKKSCWTLIIDCIRETNLDTLSKELIPINYYFEYKEKGLKAGNKGIYNENKEKDILEKELKAGTMDLNEINMFLSLLI